MRGLIAIAGALALMSCGNSDDEPNGMDGEVRGGETYGEYDARRDSYGGSKGSYGGNGCTSDCSGHEAGYAWAEDKGITDPDNCGGNSWSFIEGCRAYAEEHEGE